MKRRSLWLCAFAMCLTLLGAGLARLSYDPLNPENFAKIRKGMTHDEVRAILGDPDPDCVDDRLWIWTRGQQRYFVGQQRYFVLISFDNGMVHGKGSGGSQPDLFREWIARLLP